MKMSLKNLIIILVVFGGVYAVIQLTKREGKSKALATELVDFNPEKVTKLEILSRDSELTLAKEGEEWQVLFDEKQKIAKASTVEGVINAVSKIERGRLATRKEENWGEYEVDSTGTRVRIYEEQKLKTDLVIGKFGVEGQRQFYTFVRTFNDANVYVADGFMKMNVYPNANDYRDNTIFQLKSDSLELIRFEYPDSAFTLSNKDGWYIENRKADSVAVSNYIRSIRTVSSKGFYDGHINGMPSHKVIITSSDKDDIIIEAYQEGENWIITSSENENEVFSDQSLNEKLLKSSTDFIKPESD
ncbi:MAG: DUF4340 domain-containing protein [Bacteroidota bacterium]